MSLLLRKILSFKEKSPLTMVFDDSSQSARPIMNEFIRNAGKSGKRVIYIGFEETYRHDGTLDGLNVEFVKGIKTLDHFSTSQRWESSALRPMASILQDVKTMLSSGVSNAVVVIDCISPVFLEPVMDPVHFLGSLLLLQPLSVITSHHLDVPLIPTFPHYPSAESLLSHLSTTVLRVSSPGHHKWRVEAESNALPDPIQQDRTIEGVLSTLGSNSPQSIIISLEYRKKSGRTVVERDLMILRSGHLESLQSGKVTNMQPSNLVEFETTFNLGISERQRQSKLAVVLPHFAAQEHPTSSHTSEIEYTLDAEDDFDDEEDVDEDLLI